MLAVLYLQKRIDSVRVFKKAALLGVAFFYYSSIQAQDTTIDYHRDGWIKMKVIHTDSPYLDKYIEFYENGIVKNIYYFSVSRTNKKGTRFIKSDSVYTHFSENGIVNYTIELQNGKWNGYYTQFNDSGRISIEYLYRNNRFIGLTKSCFSNGQLQKELIWVGDTLMSANTYYKNGDTIKQTHIEHGNGVIQFCNEEGTLCCSCLVINSKFKNCGPVDKPKRVKK